MSLDYLATTTANDYNVSLIVTGIGPKDGHFRVDFDNPSYEQSLTVLRL